MSWNHRVVKKTLEDGSVEYSIRETFYNEEGVIYAYGENPVSLSCESIEDLSQYIEWCLKAIGEPLLIDGEVEFADDILSEEDIKEMKSVLSDEEFKSEMEWWDEEKKDK